MRVIGGESCGIVQARFEASSLGQDPFVPQTYILLTHSKRDGLSLFISYQKEYSYNWYIYYPEAVGERKSGDYMKIWDLSSLLPKESILNKYNNKLDKRLSR